MSTDDSELLRQYVREGSEAAFAAIVRQYAGLVYSSALRQTGDPHLAEDVMQAVFLGLANKASSLNPDVVLGGWLMTATRYAAGSTRRQRRRRQFHEQRAATMRNESLNSPANDRWDEIAPELDAALARVNQRSRDALVLRYFQNVSMREVARRLGITEVAARQRVSRGLNQMRAFLAGQGVTVPAAILAASISKNAASPPPAVVIQAAVAAINRAALTDHSASSGGAALAKGAAAVMASTQVKLLTGAAALLLLSGATVVGYKFISPTVPPAVIASTQRQITNIAEADWKKRFLSIYQLAPGQALKLVERVPVPERQQYWNSLPNSQPFPLTPKSTLIFKSSGSDLHWTNITPDWIPLGWAIMFTTGAQGFQQDASIPQEMKFTGDWVYRENATPAEIMDALAQIVSERLGRQVRFVKRTIVRNALIARGKYKFVPLAGYPNDNTIQLTDGGKAERAAQPFTTWGTLAQLFDRVSMAQGLPVIDQTGSGQIRIRICDPQNYRDGDGLARNISAQISIPFHREPRPRDVWFMVDSNGTTPPPSGR